MYRLGSLFLAGPARGPDRSDLLLAGSLFALAMVEAVLALGSERPTALALVPALTLPLAYRRSRPALVALTVSPAIAVQGLFEELYLFEQTYLGFVCMLIATYSLGRYAGGGAVMAAGGLPLAVATMIGATDASVVDAVFAAGIALAPAAGGRVVRDRTHLVEVLEAQARDLETGRRLQAEAVASRERNRVSRELHDIVSHRVSEMVVQTHAARLLATHDPRRAPGAIEAVETTGNRALTEMRRLVGVLRRGDEALALAPPPTLARLGALIDRIRADGRAVELVEEGEPSTELPAGIEVAAYRIVEQALDVAAGSTSGTAEVRVRRGRRALQLEIAEAEIGGAPPSNVEAAQAQPPAIVGDAVASVGIRERVMAFGGELQLEPTSNGGRLIRVRLPLDGRPRAAGRPRSADRPLAAGQVTAPGGWRRFRAAARFHRHADALLVLALIAIAAGEVAASSAREGPLWANAVMSTLVTAPLLLRRSYPLAALGASYSAAAVMCAFLTPASELGSLSFLVLLFLPYACAVHTGARAAWAGLALALSGVLAIEVLEQTFAWPDLIFRALVVSLSWLAGRMVSARASMAREIAERAQVLERLREEQNAAAAEAERSRIARELHDVVAHTLSVMVVQAGAARWALERQADRAVAALDIVEETGRATLAELRRLLDVLEPDEHRSALTPQPGLAQLSELLEQTRKAGLPVELQVEGDISAVPDDLQLAAYRIVQEALTNARRHAGPAQARVMVRSTATSLAVEISDDGRGTEKKDADEQPGHGLAGMRERVAVYGGEISAGPRDGGGFVVCARLPLKEPTPEGEGGAVRGPGAGAAPEREPV